VSVASAAQVVCSAACLGLAAATGHPWLVVANALFVVSGAETAGRNLGRWRTST
jgi:hypothetical protein